MLKPFEKEITRIALIHAHTGLREDEGNRVYAIAAAIIAPDTPSRTYDSLIRYNHLTTRDRYRSNVSKEMLRAAPSADEVQSRMRQFLDGIDCVAAFDASTTGADLEEFCRELPVVDLSFASEFFMPHLESYSPKSLWEYLEGRPRPRLSVSAPEMVDLAINCIKHICGRILNDTETPCATALRYYLARSNTLFGSLFIHIARHYRHYFGELFDPCISADTPRWQTFLTTAKKSDVITAPDGPLKKINIDFLDSLFAGLAQSRAGFRPRPAQVAYARHVAHAINDGAILTLEGGTGTGKTQGYLIPIMEFLRLNPHARVIISTYTKSLQDQIFEREINHTVGLTSLYRDIPVALLKGKSNYLCAVKLDNLYSDRWQGRQLLAWLFFINLIFHFRDSAGDSIGNRIFATLGPQVVRRIQQEASAKIGCPSHHVRCPAQIVNADARSARLVVTNHHKLALLDRDPALSGVFRTLIIDEANHFEQAVRNAFGIEVSSRDIRDMIEYPESLLARLGSRAAGFLRTEFEGAQSAIEAVHTALTDFGIFLRGIKSKTGMGEMNVLTHMDPPFKHGRMDDHLGTLMNALDRILKNFQWIRDDNTVKLMKMPARSREWTRSTLDRIADCIEVLKTIKTSAESRNTVTACQVFRKHWILTVQEVDVTEQILTCIGDTVDAAVFTSATLSYKESFESFRTITGMNKASNEDGHTDNAEHFRFERILSPFRKEALELIIPEDTVNGKFTNRTVWLNYVTRKLPELIRRNRGRTLVLFASYQDLEEVTARVSEIIEGEGFPLFIQQKGTPTNVLCNAFRSIKESVLFGVDTFWYGVDFKGDTLTQVVITRIPYPNPSDPLQIARKNILSQGEYWTRYYYDTHIKMQQGIGRLIRSETDSGTVIVLDSRYDRFIRT